MAITPATSARRSSCRATTWGRSTAFTTRSSTTTSRSLPRRLSQVADLAKLRWQLQREERRQCRILSTRLAWVETCYHDRAAEVNDPDCPRPHCPGTGLAYAEDIPGRYRMAIETLDKFADRVRRRDFQPFRL